MDEPSEAGKPAGQWLRNNLVTLGSAAVFTVYSAGYFRTQEAAQRFADQSVQRRAAVPAPATNKVNPGASPTEVPSATRQKLPVMHLSSGQKAQPATPSAASSIAPAPVPAPASNLPAATEAPAPVVPAQPARPAAPVVAAVAVDSAPPAAEKKLESKQLKDGVYYGWGTSRHGDIQASVEIENGRIIGAYISQCLTQYSCSWISALPPEVTARQSAEVDYVSGATQSSNAFYYAVMDALKKAR
jgi:uncharacterized protein with FMN-binding domain